ncbi:hypothetical protein GCM10020358_51740 [Amorphoplanes nipponensis]|uniref:Alpha/beta hydrolase n=1 Tax=Actinoplanes nipponensis TaxID=135950 RepID=A0A919MNF8_9ACTN|nr:alpha/beta hydrolase [Actinoplanes nipponensis]GIE50932.1 hypothetical protein Ani05nite_44660 [Actinoplanes nipponensis]
MPDRGSPSPRLALLLPGLRYSPERPLLHFARAVLHKHGWTTREVRWPERPPEPAGQDWHAWSTRLRTFVQAHVSRLLDQESTPDIALVGKSMGAFAAGVAADRSLPAVWLTPVLRDSPLPADLRRATAPFLLVGSVADPSWDPGIARDLGRPVHEARDADHSMEIADDPVRSVEVLRDVTAAVDAFVGTW